MAKNTVVCTDHQSEAKIKYPFFKGFRTLNNSNSGIYILSYQEHKIDLGFATEKSANLSLKFKNQTQGQLVHFLGTTYGAISLMLRMKLEPDIFAPVLFSMCQGGLLAMSINIDIP